MAAASPIDWTDWARVQSARADAADKVVETARRVETLAKEALRSSETMMPAAKDPKKQ